MSAVVLPKQVCKDERADSKHSIIITFFCVPDSTLFNLDFFPQWGFGKDEIYCDTETALKRLCKSLKDHLKRPLTHERRVKSVLHKLVSRAFSSGLQKSIQTFLKPFNFRTFFNFANICVVLTAAAKNCSFKPQIIVKRWCNSKQPRYLCCAESRGRTAPPGAHWGEL